jgi:hypothetical protein
VTPAGRQIFLLTVALQIPRAVIFTTSQEESVKPASTVEAIANIQIESIHNI